MTYLQFYNVKGQRILGSGGVQLVDGRLGITSLVVAGRRHLRRLPVHYTSFKVFRGPTFSNSTAISSNYTLTD